MYIYNTLTKKKEKFIPIHENEVSIYACGPTVYNYIHIGNARPACVFDVLRRYLEKKGYKVNFIQNFTDIDDKIIKKAEEEGTSYENVAKKYIEEYKIDAKGLNIKEATKNPKATENISEIIDMIGMLVDKGYAYPDKNGDVYFRVKTFKEYGKLSGQSIDELKSGARISPGESKEDPLDFALWKAVKENEPFWQSPWGKGRPGWHIECSAMATKYLGSTIDIHCGGQDLIFPHHENEIAQSECYTGVKFSNYWMHNGYINIDNKKMSKSLGNFLTVRSVAENYGYEPIRYLMLSSHYRSPINYDLETIQQCKSALSRLYNFKENLEFLLKTTKNEQKILDKNFEFSIENYKIKFYNSMDDDLNTADALASVFEMIKCVNTKLTSKDSLSKQALEVVFYQFNEFMDILGFLTSSETKKSAGVDQAEIENLIKLRQSARENKNWEEADRIRDILKEKNVVLEDTQNGVKWKIKSD